jgi:glycosyltransferase involved in cell wall biosynthesis
MLIGHYDRDIWAPGGISNYVRQITEAQQQQGHQVIFLTKQQQFIPPDRLQQTVAIADDADLYQQAQQLGLDILHLHTEVSHLPSNVGFQVLRTVHEHRPYCPSGSRYLANTQQPCNYQYSLGGCLRRHFSQHCGSIRPHNLMANFSSTWNEIKVLGQIPAVMTVSHFLKAQMVEFGYEADRIHVLPLFTPPLTATTPPPDEEMPHFTFLGRVTQQKGVPWLLQAIQRINLPIHLDVAGAGAQLQDMQILAHRLGVSEQVTFHGWLDRAQVSELIQQSRAVIFPSVWHEPAGFITLEAMAHARAVIASRSGGIPEILQDGYTGFLVPPNDVLAMAQQIELLATNWQLARQLGEAGRQVAQDSYTFERHFNGLMQLYERTLAHEHCVDH